MDTEILKPFTREMYLQEQLRVRQKYSEIEKASQGILSISTVKGDTLCCGSAVVIEGGRVLTAAHIVKKADQITLFSPTQRTKIEPIAVKLADKLDCAVLQIPTDFQDIPPLSVSTNFTGGEAFLIGFPVFNETFHQHA